MLDASAALAWVFERADDAEAAVARGLLGRLASEEVLVPELWHLEILNALTVGQRRGVISTAKVLDFIGRLDALPIKTDETSMADRREQIFALAREHELSAYDAAYLDLAMRRGASLATFDRGLAAACERAGVARS
ncbi:MAG: type II toxin-antitoxin system VapC family toxin [Phenylobacterium sp.]|nr:type II toxin-antitoxin system VapC family toxin [Phenylobacterium sp.]